jgi:hypothetical protein
MSKSGKGNNSIGEKKCKSMPLLKNKKDPFVLK